jgi:hypothetical protein
MIAFNDFLVFTIEHIRILAEKLRKNMKNDRAQYLKKRGKP